jgi:hypothetical protein
MWNWLLPIFRRRDGLDLFDGARYFASADGEQFFMRSRNGCVWRRDSAAGALPGYGPWMWSLVDGLPKHCIAATEQDAARWPEGWEPPPETLGSGWVRV